MPSRNCLPTDNWEETRKNIPGKPAKDPVKVFYSDRPAELIVIEGKPSMAPVVGTKLMYIKNTDADLFFHTATASYYFLSSGRWFTGKSFVEGWKFAPDELPAEFAEIPEDHEKGHVLASVRGTPAASEAVIMASIPERATIKRDEASLEVGYEGEPKFTGVAGEKGDTGVEFALNSNFDVFKVGETYYCCYQGVWFQAPTATGPWVVCDKVPEAIYAIPPEHPKHNVTYVYVYSSTPTTVETGYTSGYTGSYIVNGLVTFGLGYWVAKEIYDNSYWPYWRRYHCHPCWYGYGCRATWYNGAYWRGASRWYGPYGGAGRGAIYNPITGGWARGGYAYGPRGAAYGRAAYNPYTNTFGAKARVTTPYGSWSKGVVSRNGNWARGGSYTNARGTVGGVQGSRGGAAVGWDKRFGGQGGAVRTPGGDVYVGRDGNVHKLDPGSGNWQTREGNNVENHRHQRTQARAGQRCFALAARHQPAARRWRPGGQDLSTQYQAEHRRSCQAEHPSLGAADQAGDSPELPGPPFSRASPRRGPRCNPPGRARVPRCNRAPPASWIARPTRVRAAAARR